jgi:hypothetical protein
LGGGWGWGGYGDPLWAPVYSYQVATTPTPKSKSSRLKMGGGTNILLGMIVLLLGLIFYKLR